MFALTETFTHTRGFHITPLEMEGVGLIFLPKEIEGQLEYENLSNTIRQSESFTEGIEYIVLRNSKLMKIKELLKRRNSIASLYPKQANALITLTEPGLYTAMILSRKNNAQAFRRWITCEVLPAIRKTGMYKTPFSSDRIHEPAVLAKLIEKINSLEQVCGKFASFQQYTIHAFERIEAVLSESFPHDMFEGWRKIKSIVDDMTRIYGLSEIEQKRYIRELCESHDVQLPEKAFLENESLFLDLQEIATKIGVYSVANKPHSRLMAALIRYLGLDKYCYMEKAVAKYSDKVIPHIVKWLQDIRYPNTLEFLCQETGKIKKFQVRYRLKQQRQWE